MSLPSRIVIRVGKRIQRLGGDQDQRFAPTRYEGLEEGSQIGAYVKVEDILERVMANVAKPAEIFLSDVKDGLGKRHEVCRETKERGGRGIKDVSRIQVKSIDDEFHDIEGS